MLYWTLHEQQFIVLDQEWWHFEFGTRLWSAISGNPVRYTAIGVD
jgi:D-alanyl-D-alanine dipeptidase